MSEQPKWDFNTPDTSTSTQDKLHESSMFDSWDSRYTPTTLSEAREMSYAPHLTQTMANLLPSTLQLGKDIIYPLFNPKKTYKSFKELGKSIYYKIAVSGTQEEEERVADAVGQYFKDRYGSIENIGKTFRQDPMGLASDVALLMAGGGGIMVKMPSSTSKVVGSAILNASKYAPENVALSNSAKTIRWGWDNGVAPFTSAMLGKLTSTSSDAVNVAVQSGKAGGETRVLFRDFMSSRKDGMKMVSDLVDNFEQFRINNIKNGGKDWSKIANIPLTEKQLASLRKVLADLKDEAKLVMADGTVIKNASGLSEQATKVHSKIVGLIEGFLNNPQAKSLHTIEGLDWLKKALDNQMPSGLNVNQVGGSVVAMARGGVNNIIKFDEAGQLTTYGKMMAGYEEMIFLEQLMKKELGLGNKVNAGNILRKIQQIMKQNQQSGYGFRFDLLKDLDPDMITKLGGQAFEPIMPGTGLGVGGVLDPASAIALGVGMSSLTSPRLMGNVALAVGDAQRLWNNYARPVTNRVGLLSDMTGNKLTNISSQVGQIGAETSGQGLLTQGMSPTEIMYDFNKRNEDN